MVLVSTAVEALHHATSALSRADLIQRVLELSQTCAEQLGIIQRQEDEIQALLCKSSTSAEGAVHESSACILPAGSRRQKHEMVATEDIVGPLLLDASGNSPHGHSTSTLLPRGSCSTAEVASGTYLEVSSTATCIFPQSPSGLHTSFTGPEPEHTQCNVRQPDVDLGQSMDPAPLQELTPTAPATHLHFFPVSCPTASPSTLLTDDLTTQAPQSVSQPPAPSAPEPVDPSFMTASFRPPTSSAGIVAGHASLSATFEYPPAVSTVLAPPAGPGSPAAVVVTAEAADDATPSTVEVRSL